MNREKKNGRPIENNRPVKILETGEVYSSYRDAADAVNGDRSCVWQCVKGYRVKHKGYTFVYTNDEPK